MKKKPKIAVVTSDQNSILAKQLAERLHLSFMPNTLEDYDYLLAYEHNHLALQWKKQSLCVDFLSPTLLYRLKRLSLRKELLARALGCSPAKQPAIIDATAGFGKDSFILAALGFNMTLIERSPIVHALLQDALQRAKQAPQIAPIIQRMHLILSDAKTFLYELPENLRPQVIYLDPMFPPRHKTALAKKEMAVLQDLLGEQEDAETLFKVAISCATQRVVVKRPRLADTISHDEPDFSLKGSSSRFDIYLT